MPTPSETNNGKVAKVVSNGEGGYKWSAETPAGGIEYFDITYTCTEEYGDGTIDKTIAQILNAIEQGKILRFKWGDEAYFGEHTVTLAGSTTSYSIFYNDGNFDSIFVIFYGAGDSDSNYQFSIEIRSNYVAGTSTFWA